MQSLSIFRLGPVHRHRTRQRLTFDERGWGSITGHHCALWWPDFMHCRVFTPVSPISCMHCNRRHVAATSPPLDDRWPFVTTELAAPSVNQPDVLLLSTWKPQSIFCFEPRWILARAGVSRRQWLPGELAEFSVSILMLQLPTVCLWCWF